MQFPRSSGILLHPTSLPGPYGIGDLGKEAFHFVDFLVEAGQTYWQVLPLGPTGFGDSPYQSFCAFAGNPLLISPDLLLEENLLAEDALASIPAFPDEKVDYGPVIDWKFELLKKSHSWFRAHRSNEQQQAFDAWCQENTAWLHDFATFMALKHDHDGIIWTLWAEPLRDRHENVLHEWRSNHPEEIEAHMYWQWLFATQWSRLHEYATSKGIRFIGDIPIYVAHDSSDVWSNRDMFLLDDHGNPTVVAGVPPDYFSETGQLWGNPIYNWKWLQDRGYDWWMKRFQQCLTQVDIVRLDHFRGFESYWEVPAAEETAINGRWVQGPSEMIFDTLLYVLGDLPIIAENLGVITEEVEALRNRFDLPGMAVLQFGFGSDAQNTHLPHTYDKNCVAYSATHDNDTLMSWWNAANTEETTLSQNEIDRERNYAREYLNYQHGEFHWVAIRSLIQSVAHTAIVPMQDVLGLGHEARMNRPAIGEGNWQWRMKQQALNDAAKQLRSLCEIYGRTEPIAEEPTETD